MLPLSASSMATEVLKELATFSSWSPVWAL
jgi:hypothetical protein